MWSAEHEWGPLSCLTGRMLFVECPPRFSKPFPKRFPRGFLWCTGSFVHSTWHRVALYCHVCVRTVLHSHAWPSMQYGVDAIFAFYSCVELHSWYWAALYCTGTLCIVLDCIALYGVVSIEVHRSARFTRCFPTLLFHSIVLYWTILDSSRLYCTIICSELVC